MYMLVHMHHCNTISKIRNIKMCHSEKIMSEIFYSRHFASKCHIRHNSSYNASIVMATYCFNLAAILAGSVMYLSSRLITRDQQAKIADTQILGKHVEWHIFTFLKSLTILTHY